MGFKSVTFLISQDKFSYEEKYYHTGNVSLQQCLDDAVNLAEARRELLGKGPVFQAYKVSDDDVFRDSLLTVGPKPFNDGTNNKGTGIDDLSADAPFHAILIRLDCGAANKTRSMRRLSGFPDVLQVSPNGPMLTASYVKLFKTYADELTSGKWGCKVLQKDGAAVPKPCTNATGAVGPLTITCPAHGFAVGNMVKLAGFKGAGDTAPNGIFQIETVPTQNTFTCKGLTGSWTTTIPGTASLRTYVIEQINKVSIIREVPVKKGAGSLRPRGANRKKPR